MKIRTIALGVIVLGLGGLIAYRILNNKEKDGPDSKGPKKPTVVSGVIL